MIGVTVCLAVVAAAAIVALVLERRGSRAQLDRVLDAARDERHILLTRIQAPEVAAYLPAPGTAAAAPAPVSDPEPDESHLIGLVA